MRTILACLILALALCAQPPDVARGPIAFASATTDSAIWVGAGNPNGVVAWRLTYFVDGTNFTAAQVGIQGADAANSAGCAAATWATIATAGANLVESVNPSVSGAQGNVAVKSYYPCIRMIVTAVTGAGGTVSATLQGWKGLFVFPASASISNTVTVQGGAAVGAPPSTNPLPQGVIDGSGNLYIPDYCTKKATFAFAAASGNVQVIAVSGGLTARICHISFAGDAVTNLKLVNGTGATCGTPADETGTYQQVLGFAFDWTTGPLPTTAAKTICLNSSATVTGGGTVIYSQR